MIVLGIDTATAVATVGVVRDGEVAAELCEVAPGAHARCLAALTENVLRGAGIGLADVEGIAVSIGPGSFTGLRIGLSFAKGIAYAGGHRLVAVPTLEALAAAAPPVACVAACLDARKGEVYLGLYRRSGNDLLAVAPEAALPPEEALERILECARHDPVVLVGDAGERYGDVFSQLPELRTAPFSEVHPRGGIVARIGASRLADGGGADKAALVPRYLRASEAESRFSGLR